MKNVSPRQNFESHDLSPTRFARKNGECPSVWRVVSGRWGCSCIGGRPSSWGEGVTPPSGIRISGVFEGLCGNISNGIETADGAAFLEQSSNYVKSII